MVRKLYDDDGHQPDSILQDHSRAAGRITSGVSAAGLPMSTVLDATRADYEAAHERHLQGIPYAGIDLGFREVNDFLNGACPEEMTVGAARPSIGKTTLFWQLALHAARNGSRVAGISLEMSRRQVGGLLLRLQAGLRPEGLRKGNLSDEAVQRMGVADGELRAMPITVVDQVPMDIDQVRATMLGIEAMGHVDLWVIDYLQLITNDASDGQLDIISRVLKTLTLELSTHVFLLSQLNRDCERRSDKRPSMADLRGSGGIEQNANNVVMIHRPGFYPELIRECRRRAKENGNDAGDAVAKLIGHVELIFTKTRNGPTGETKGVAWNRDRARFEEALDGERHF